MSYKYVVLSDFPVSYYTLDEVKSGSIQDYNQVLSLYPTYQAVKNAFQSYSDIAGLPVLDYSGNNNHGVVSGISGSKLMPLVSGGIYGTLISDQTTITTVCPGMANSLYSDNSFSMEIWVKPPAVSSNRVTLFGDPNQNTPIGIFYQNGDVIFQVGANSTRYKITNSKATHIVALYNKNSLSLYFDGELVSSNSIDNYMFTNSSTTFQIGPSLPNNEFVVDAAAAYRYNLSQDQIKKHYVYGIKEIKYMQIVNPDGGYLFSLNHSKIRPSLQFYYPLTKTWTQLVSGSALVSPDQSYVTFAKTNTSATASFSFIEELYIPSGIGVNSSQISWDSDVSNIVVEVSLDNTNWQPCINNNPIPYFNKNDAVTSGLIYLRVTMTSTDTSIDLPKLKSISLDFFQDKDFYADNSGDRVYSSKDYGLSRFNSRILSYNDYNGLKMYNGGGFNVDIQESIKTIEMIFTPVSGQNVLFSSNTKIFEWNSSGVINKSGIASIYVNGVDWTSATNISEFFTKNMPHHVVVVLSSAATSNIKFNINQDGSKYGSKNIYNNLALYPDQFDSSKAISHYLLYTNRYFVQVNDTSMSVSESVIGNDNTPYYINNTEYTASSI